MQMTCCCVHLKDPRSNLLHLSVTACEKREHFHDMESKFHFVSIQLSFKSKSDYIQNSETKRGRRDVSMSGHGGCWNGG